MTHAQVEQAVLYRIALINGIRATAISLGENGAVFCRIGRELRCLCQRDSNYWNELEVKIITEMVIEHVSRE
jgi:hypothetical protein